MPHVPPWLLARPIAHRGLHDHERPENSLASFDAAVAADYPIELDVRLGPGGDIIVFHDDDLERMTGAKGRVDDAPWSRLETLRLGGTDEPIPRLRDVLDRVKGRVPLVIDMKASRHAGKLELAVHEALADYKGDVALQSFHPIGLAKIRRVSRSRVLGVLASDFVEDDLARPLKYILRRLFLAPLSIPDYVGYELRCLPFWATDVARKAGLALLAWTVRSEADLLRARALADNVIFEGIRP
jgi:glycerophosphoryl diester phosphodiesterase